MSAIYFISLLHATFLMILQIIHNNIILRRNETYPFSNVMDIGFSFCLLYSLISTHMHTHITYSLFNIIIL